MKLALGLALGLVMGPGLRGADLSCTRAGLRAATELYLAAQGKGETASLPLARGLSYVENFKALPIGEGLIRKALKIDFQRSFLDVASCQTFTEVIVNDAKEPYVLGTRLRVNHGLIAEIEVVWTTTGYWLFNAADYLKYSSSEDWGEIPAKRRAGRAELESAAGAYLDAFLEKKTERVPWGYPCRRIEGGLYTGKGVAADTCEEGVPAGVNITNRHTVVDETLGAVVVFCTFGASGPADTHLFRLERGKLRFVHTLTHLLQRSGPGGGGAGPR